MSIAATSNYAQFHAATPVNGAQDLLRRVMSSPTGARIVAMYSQYGAQLPQIRIADPSTLPSNYNGMYDRSTNTVTINAALLTQQPEQAVVTLSHELFHGLDNASGISSRLDHLTEESRAYAVASRVQHDLGYPMGAVGPTAQAAYGAADLTGAVTAARRAIIARGHVE